MSARHPRQRKRLGDSVPFSVGRKSPNGFSPWKAKEIFSSTLERVVRRNVAPKIYLIMATVIVNNDANVQVANGGENMRLRNSMSIDNLLVAFPDNLPSDFMLKFHNDLRYQRNRTEWSDKCYCGLVPFYNGVEHIEFAMLQWDLLVEDIATVSANGEFAGFVTPNDELHTYARSTASADITIESWLQGVAKHFNDNAKNYKFTKLSYLCKYESRLYTRVLLGIIKK